MNTTTPWKARTINGTFQINFDTEYRGYSIQPQFNYSDGTTDFNVFELDAEEGFMMPRCTLSYVKEVINSIREEKPEDFRVTTSNPMGMGENITKFNWLSQAQLFADRFSGRLNLTDLPIYQEQPLFIGGAANGNY